MGSYGWESSCSSFFSPRRLNHRSFFKTRVQGKVAVITGYRVMIAFFGFGVQIGIAKDSDARTWLSAAAQIAAKKPGITDRRWLEASSKRMQENDQKNRQMPKHFPRG